MFTKSSSWSQTKTKQKWKKIKNENSNFVWRFSSCLETETENEGLKQISALIQQELIHNRISNKKYILLSNLLTSYNNTNKLDNNYLQLLLNQQGAEEAAPQPVVPLAQPRHKAAYIGKAPQFCLQKDKNLFKIWREKLNMFQISSRLSMTADDERVHDARRVALSAALNNNMIRFIQSIDFNIRTRCNL